MATLQIQDVFEPYYAGKEAARSGPVDAGPTARPDESPIATKRPDLRRQRLEMAEKRFVRALSRMPNRDL